MGENEAGYLSLVRNVLENGTTRENRTGIKTKTIFGAQLRSSLRCNKLPMLTTKFVSFQNVLHELLWFLNGQTNQQILEAKNVNIWCANASREFLDSRKLFHYKEYKTLGPIYGFQWRHFGAKYTDCDADYTSQGVDQIQNCLDLIRNDPTNRRIVMSAWNPVDLDKMVLPPCHVLMQFYVDMKRRELSGHLYQRSGDLMLGVPYNLLSYSLLVHIMARKCGLNTGELVTSYGVLDTYEDHIDNAKIQIEREPYPAPNLEKNFDKDLDFSYLNLGHFILKDYKHHSKLAFKMAV